MDNLFCHMERGLSSIDGIKIDVFLRTLQRREKKVSNGWQAVKNPDGSWSIRRFNDGIVIGDTQKTYDDEAEAREVAWNLLMVDMSREHGWRWD